MENELRYLNALRNRLIEKGWTQGELGGSEGPNCIIGAMSYVRGTHDIELEDIERAFKALHDASNARGASDLVTLNDFAVRDFNDLLSFFDDAERRIKEHG